MKKVIAAIISLLFLLTLSGCGFKISYWGGMTRNQCEKYVTEQLKEKYNEEFTVVKFIKTGSGELKGVCAPERDERLLFDIELEKGYKDELELDDAYIQGIVRDEMLEPANAVLSKHFKRQLEGHQTGGSRPEENLHRCHSGRGRGEPAPIRRNVAETVSLLREKLGG